MKNLICFLFICSLFTFVSSCSSEVGEADESFLERDFSPLFIGKYLEYVVDSTLFDNQGNTVVNTSSFVREELVETFVDEVGDSVFRVERFWRSDALETWELTDVWSVKMQNNALVRSEDNLNFVKLIFPPTAGQKWNGNQLIDTDIKIEVRGELLEFFKFWEDDYVIVNRGAEQLGAENFDEVVTVAHADISTQIERRYSQEKYAKGVGLVSRTLEILDIDCSQCPAEEIPWVDKATKGFILNQTITGYN